MIFEIYREYPFYGYRRIHVELRKRGLIINHKRVQKLLKQAGLCAIYPAKNTSLRNQQHKVFPYLLKGLIINRKNYVWQVDITYIKIRGGSLYLICLIDVFSRKIMGWVLSIFLDAESCAEAYQNAICNHGVVPDIVNSDQGCQFTSELWISVIHSSGARISMDGKGRCKDNIYIERFWRAIKYEAIYLQTLETVHQAHEAIAKYITFYNQTRSHQSLNYHTPNDIYEKNFIPTKAELFDSFIMKNAKESSILTNI
jgi:putative transposase